MNFLTNSIRTKCLQICTNFRSARYISLSKITQKSNKERIEPEDGPIKYSRSEAAQWQARDSRIGVRTEMPWFQPYVISLSLGIFLLYFCVFREESDIDIGLDRSLFDHIEGLEEKQIMIRINYNREHNLDTRALEERLAEIHRLKKQL
ncbi:uncharacterized protein LOC123296791 [Chrysoperla carnea]|uniref:uncharacterized protein LOC123296791 n=1 Tax=Chrysoperla carnea TaxID=189513 RepID=UPI001D07BAAE|nr:uncharacterized protein LOC123296791 [Chrysoperla carnea]